MAAEQVPDPTATAASAQQEIQQPPEPPEPPGLGSDGEDTVDDIETLRNMINMLRENVNELKDNNRKCPTNSEDNIGTNSEEDNIGMQTEESLPLGYALWIFKKHIFQEINIQAWGDGSHSRTEVTFGGQWGITCWGQGGWGGDKGYGAIYPPQIASPSQASPPPV